MKVHPQNKLMLLLVSLDNPLWSRLFPPNKRVKEQINGVIRVAHGTIANWRKGKKVSPLAATAAFNGIKQRIATEVSNKKEAEELTAIVDKFTQVFFSNDADCVVKAAKTLSIPINKYQKIIDEAIYARLPLFPGMYYEGTPGELHAKEDCNELRGLHYAWMRRGSLWLRCPLQVRYVLKIHDGFCIRCKMNLPMIEPELTQTYWHYDGFVVVRDHKIFWTLQKRGTRREDYVHFITCSARTHDGEPTMAGKYLTLGQDANDSIVSDDILVRRVQADDYQKITERMHTDAAVLDEADSEPIGQLWKEFSAESKPLKTQKTKKTNTKKRQSHGNQGIEKIGKPAH